MPNDRQLRRIAIVGGGTAGWMAASVLARALPGTGTRITVIESADIGTVGVGEATIPPIIDLLRFLNINERDFIRFTGATFKLGIRFADWQRLGHDYWHPFGTFGTPINLRPFYHAWQRVKGAGAAPRLDDFSVCAALAGAGKLELPAQDGASAAAGLRYALHFDARLVADYLRAYATALGVERLERTVAQTTLRADGFLDELIFADGSRLTADLYLDCSGFRGILIEDALHTGYLDWTQWLPCDRAVAVPSANTLPRRPYTEARARSAGWQWRIPLQHRAGNGYVYSAAHLSDAQALDDLLSQLPGTPASAPRQLRFTTGRRKLFWNRNCVALGLASGFLEPLESTSIHLVMSGLYKLLEHFPDAGFEQRNIDSYNRELTAESETIRDFLIAHYCLSGRKDSTFWQDCGQMRLPDALQERIELYRGTGRIRCRPGDLFTDLSWFYIFDGMGLVPQAHDPLIDVVGSAQLHEILATLARATSSVVDAARTHESYLSGEFKAR